MTPNAAMAGLVGIVILAVSVVIGFAALLGPSALSWWPLAANPFPQVLQ